MELVEIGTIDVGLSHTRQRDAAVEKRLLVSIQERDMLDPVSVVRADDQKHWVLLDGFKRYRCAVKLGMAMVPVESIGSDIVVGILTMLRRDEAGGISTIEQAALIEELHKEHSLSIYDIAIHLGRSPSWVSMRLGMIDQMSCVVREKIMNGAFPARSYLYGLKGFTRVNKIPPKDVDACVRALSGKRLSTRDLFILSRAYFKGGENVRRLILDGDIHRALRVLKNDDSGMECVVDARERAFLVDLRSASSTMNRLAQSAPTMQGMSTESSNYVNLWCAAILNAMSSFERAIKEIYERTRPAGRSPDMPSSGTKQTSDCTVASA
jgi:predicted transcriptional regulator